LKADKRKEVNQIKSSKLIYFSKVKQKKLKILGCFINTRTYTLFRANKFIAFICCKFVGPEQCICAGIYETTSYIGEKKIE
jgi:hypothetical protein